MSYFKSTLTPEELEKINPPKKSKKTTETQEIKFDKIELKDDDPRTIFDYGKHFLPKQEKALTKKLKQINKQIENYDKNLEKLKSLKKDMEHELTIIQNIQFKN